MSGYRHPLRTAREARHWSIDALAELTGLSRRTLLRAEQGRGLNPSSRQLICNVFGMSAVELGLTFRQAGSRPGQATLHCPRPPIGERALRPFDGPTQVTPAHVEATRELTRTFQRQDNRLGGGYALSVAAQHLDFTVIPLLRHGQYADDVGHALLEVAAHLAQVVAWMAYDVQDHPSAKLHGESAGTGKRCW
jgi:transcriptional regulator with XRE-family HTH domain